MGDWENLVVVCGATPYAGVRLLDQHLADGLSEYAPVLYVDPPLSVLTRFRNRRAFEASYGSGLHHVARRLHVLSPRVLPLKERPIGKQVALALTRRAMRRAVASLGASSVAAVIVPSLDPLFGALGERVSVFYASDDFVAGAELMGLGQRRLRRLAQQQPRRADLVVAVSPTLVEGLRGPGVEPVLIPNGCDVDHFGRTAVPSVESPPVVAFVGHLSDRVDVDLLNDVAAAGVELVIVGAKQATLSAGRFDALLGRENVEWLGEIDYEHLPEVLSRATTCLLPYTDSAFNRASFPLKVLEYLAAGRRVVATNLPAMVWLDTELVSIAARASDFTPLVLASVASPLGQQEVAQRRAFASRHSWEDRVQRLAGLLGLGGSAVGGGTS